MVMVSIYWSFHRRKATIEYALREGLSGKGKGEREKERRNDKTDLGSVKDLTTIDLDRRPEEYNVLRSTPVDVNVRKMLST